MTLLLRYVLARILFIETGDVVKYRNSVIFAAYFIWISQNICHIMHWCQISFHIPRQCVHANANTTLWRHQMETFPRYWPFVRGIHQSPVDYPEKGLWHGALTLYLICASTNDWTIGVSVIWDAIALIITSLWWYLTSLKLRKILWVIGVTYKGIGQDLDGCDS